MSHAYGWRPQRPDHRDQLFALEERVYRGHQLPKRYDLWEHGLCPPIWNQLQTNSCTGHGSVRTYLTEAKRQGLSLPMLSRLMAYFDGRRIEGSQAYDNGAVIRDVIKGLATWGCCPESEWPFDPSQVTTEPPGQCYADASKHLAIKYQLINPNDRGAPMRTAVASGLAVCFGFSVPESFEDGSWDPARQVLPLPAPSEGFVGGHCVAITGYDFTCKDFPVPHFICDNSWGADWGSDGRFRLDYRWCTATENGYALASDFWVLQKTT